MKRIFLTAAILFTGSGIWAQNLNPTVEVTNIYAREATGIEKPGQLLQLPDSVFQFNLDFDYSVNRTPYKGAYEFHPYLVQLRPMDRPVSEGSLFLRAGAGYSLHPELTAVWTPLSKDGFRLNLYGDHKSYLGKYQNIGLDGQSVWTADGTTRSGRNLRTAVGADILWNFTGATLLADVQYQNITASDLYANVLSNNRLVAEARIRSQAGSAFAYEAGTRLAFVNAPNGFAETRTLTDAMAGMHLGVNYLKISLSAETVSQPAGTVGLIGIAPHYILSVGGFNMDLGAKLSFRISSDDLFCPQRAGLIIPDVRVSYELIPDAMQLRLFATGGNNLVSYDSLLSRNPFIAGFGWNTDIHIERLNVGGGIRGNLAAKFHYDLKLGYKWNQNAWTWGYDLGDAPAMGYIGHLHTFYADAQLGWQTDRLDVAANIYYGYTPAPKVETPLQERLFAPAPFRAQAHAYYNWGGRIRAGVTLEARDKMECKYSSIPGYLDLGLGGELQMSRNLGLWLRAGNLLNQTIERIPFYAENGPYFTIGATWTL